MAKAGVIKGFEILGFQRRGLAYDVHFRVTGYRYLDNWRLEGKKARDLYDGQDYHSHSIKDCADELQALSRFMEDWKNEEVKYI